MFRIFEFFDCFTIFSSLCISEVDVNTTVVTASIPIVIQDGQRKKGIRAVAGLQMKYENFADLFMDSFTSCENYPCTQTLTCKNDVSVIS